MASTSRDALPTLVPHLSNGLSDALDRYRNALADAPPGTTLPDEGSFAKGLSDMDQNQFRREAQSVRSSIIQAGTVARSPDSHSASTVDSPQNSSPISPHALETVSYTSDALSTHGGGQVAPADPLQTVAGAWSDNGDFELNASVAVPSDRGPKTRVGFGHSLVDYEILGELGAGGMGVVYKARHIALNRMVALKMILAGGRATQTQLARFRGEALAVAKLDHPNIVRVYDIGEHDGAPFFAMEYVDGDALDKKLDHKPMEPPAAAALVESVARAMHYAHQMGVIHRDLKPANIMLTHDGIPKIADFGLAKQLDGDEEGMTRTGVVMGTPNYMAPEQAEGNTKHVDHLADVYALGATLYELVTGRPPFQGASAIAIIAQVRSNDPVNPGQLTPGLSKDVETICLKCLQKEPARRYATAEALADDLRRFRNGEPIVARPVSSVELIRRWCRRKPREATLTLTAAGLIAVLLVGAIVAAIVFRFQKAEIAVANENLNQQKAEVERANVDLVASNRAITRQSDLNAEQARYMVRNLAAELKVLGLSKSRERLVQYVLSNLNRLERLTEEGAGIADRSRVSALVQIGELFQELANDRDRAGEFLPKAEEFYKKAHGVAQTMAAQNPDSDLARGNLALTLSRLGGLALLQGQLPEAEKFFIEALRLRQEIVESPRSRPGTREYLFPADTIASLAESHNARATLADAQKDAVAAAGHRSKALDLRRKAYEMAKKDPATTEEPAGLAPFQQELAKSYLQKAAAAAAADKLAEAREDLKLALELRQQAVTENAEGLPYKKELAALLFKIGADQLGAGEAAEARDSFDRMATLMDQVVKQGDEATSQENRRLYALALYGVGVAGRKAGDPKKATAAMRECVRLREELYREEDNPRNAWGLMVALARSGNTDRAVKILREEQDRNRRPDHFWFNAACAYSLCAESVALGKPDDKLTADEKKKRSGFVVDALASVDKVFEVKSPKSAELRNDPDLEYLQRLPAFREKLDAHLPAK